MAYAHALIEVPVDPEDASKGVVKYSRGEEVPADLPGFDELVEGGSIADEPYDPEADKVPAPDTVEIDGVRYVKVADGAEATDERE
jgi:hypothetical protein